MASSPCTLEGQERPERCKRTVLIIDLVESVHLMELDEEGTIARWRSVLDRLEEHLGSCANARLVKSLGDGVLVECETAQHALAIGFWLHSLCEVMTATTPECRMRLRMGLHSCNVVRDQRDIFGSGVNLTARLTTLARPGAIAASSEVMAEIQLPAGVSVESWGACHLKHVSKPVQVYLLSARQGPRGLANSHFAPPSLDRPSLVILPFWTEADETLARSVTERLAHSLHRSRTLDLLPFDLDGPALPLPRGIEEASSRGAEYVLVGSLTKEVDRVAIQVRLFDTRSAQQRWAARFVIDPESLIDRSDSVIEAIHRSMHRAIREHEHVAVKALPSFNISSLSLQATAVSLMHAGSAIEFENSRGILECLSDRNPRFALAHAHLAQWHVIAVMRGLTGRAIASAPALGHVHRALELDPNCSLALAVLGYAQCHILHDLSSASTTLDEATSRFPRDALGWTYRAVVRGLFGDRPEAAMSMQRALLLPVPRPLRHYRDAIACTTMLSDGDFSRAIQMARGSLAVNRVHAPTWRTLAIAQSRLGQLEQARRTVRVLRRLQPELSVASYLAMWPAHAQAHFSGAASDLYRAGLPEEIDRGEK